MARYALTTTDLTGGNIMFDTNALFKADTMKADMGHALVVSRGFFSGFGIDVTVDDEYIYFDQWLALRRGSDTFETIAESVERPVWVVEKEVYYAGSYMEPPDADLVEIASKERLYDALMVILVEWTENRYSGDLDRLVESHPRRGVEDYDGSMERTEDWGKYWDEAKGELPSCTYEVS